MDYRRKITCLRQRPTMIARKSLERSASRQSFHSPGMDTEHDVEVFPTHFHLLDTVYEKGITLSRESLLEVELHLTRHSELKKWDVTITLAPSLVVS